MIAPDRRKVPLIRDDVINFTWLAERPRARTTIAIQQKLAKDFDNDPDSKVRRPVKIPAMEKEAIEIMERVLIHLLPYLDKFPEDKTALEIGWKTYSMLDNEEKKNELKTRWEAIK